MIQLYCPHCRNALRLELAVYSEPQQSAFDEALEGRRAAPNIEALLETIDENALDSKTLQFVAETKARFEKYGSRIRMSPKQMAWLKSISEGKANKEF